MDVVSETGQVFVAAGEGLLADDDGGDTWSEVGPVHDNVRLVAAAPLPWRASRPFLPRKKVPSDQAV